MRKAIVRESDGFVTNVIEIEDGANWPIPNGCYLVDAVNNGSPGDTWDGKEFLRSAIQAVKPPRDLAVEIDSLNARVDNIEADISKLSLSPKPLDTGSSPY